MDALALFIGLYRLLGYGVVAMFMCDLDVLFCDRRFADPVFIPRYPLLIGFWSLY